MKPGKAKWIVGGSIIIATIVGMSFMQLQDNLVYFFTPEEASAKAAELKDKTIKIGALVQKGSVQWDASSLSLNFMLTDMQGHDITVRHKGPPPDLFKDGQGVVAEGKVSGDGKSFTATKLMVKHSEEYKKPDASHSIDSKLLQQSIFKN